MDSGAFFYGIIPLFLFVVVDSFLGLKYALLTAIFAGIFEAAISYYYFRELDFVTAFSLSLVLVMAFLSYRLKSPLFIKFQPVVLSLVLGMGLIISYLIDMPILVSMMTKYQGQMPESVQARLQDPLLIQIFRETTLFGGISICLHGLVTAFAALKLSNWWWLGLRALGFYLFFTLAFFAAILKVQLL